MHLKYFTRLLIGIILFIFIDNNLYSQNLVPNGDFEEKFDCPKYHKSHNRSIFENLKDWFAIENSSHSEKLFREAYNYLNTCGFGEFIGGCTICIPYDIVYFDSYQENKHQMKRWNNFGTHSMEGC